MAASITRSLPVQVLQLYHLMYNDSFVIQRERVNGQKKKSPGATAKYFLHRSSSIRVPTNNRLSSSRILFYPWCFLRSLKEQITASNSRGRRKEADYRQHGHVAGPNFLRRLGCCYAPIGVILIPCPHLFCHWGVSHAALAFVL